MRKIVNCTIAAALLGCLGLGNSPSNTDRQDNDACERPMIELVYKQHHIAAIVPDGTYERFEHESGKKVYCVQTFGTLSGTYVDGDDGTCNRTIDAITYIEEGTGLRRTRICYEDDLHLKCMAAQRLTEIFYKRNNIERVLNVWKSHRGSCEEDACELEVPLYSKSMTNVRF